MIKAQILKMKSSNHGSEGDFKLWVLAGLTPLLLTIISILICRQLDQIDNAIAELTEVSSSTSDRTTKLETGYAVTIPAIQHDISEIKSDIKEISKGRK